MKGKIAKKVIMLTFICMLTMFDIFVVSKQIVQADGEEQIKQEETEVIITQGIEKYFELSENQTLLQQRIETSLNKDDKVKTAENLTVKVPVIKETTPDTAIVLLNGVKLPDNTYFYDVQNKKVDISVNKDNGLTDDQSTYQVIYTYTDISKDNAISDRTGLNTLVSVDIEGEESIASGDSQDIDPEEKGSIISLTGDITNEVYKGYLYQGTQSPTSYAEINRIEISNVDNLDAVTISNVSETFVEEEKVIDSRTNEETTIENERNIDQLVYYTLTKISKEDMIRILGNDGTITIYNQNDEVLAELNKDTQTDEDGNLVVQYNTEEVTKLKIVTTKPVQEGKIEFYHEKAIKAATGFLRPDIEKFDYLRETIQANEETAVMNMKLIEPTTQFDMTLNKTDYSTMNTNKDIEISLTLKNNSYNMSLYENPEIEIVFPEEVQNLEIQDQVNILYDSELSIRESYVEGNVVHILLNGVQTNYKEIGTQINLKVNMEFDKTLTNRTSEIVTKIINRGEEVENRKEVSITSPREIITVNNIQELGVESYGEEKQLEAQLARNSESRTIQVESEIINNIDNTTSVKVLGEFPTNDNQNNLGVIINTPVQVEGTNATIYYTSNEKATENLEETENGWVTDLNSLTNAKKYLITINEMNPDTSVKFVYSASVPADLEYNQKAREGYTVYYTDAQSNVSNKVEATNVLMTTGDGPIVEAELVAKVNGEAINTGDTVKAGEKISYEVNLTNTGTAEATDIAVDLNISQSNDPGNNEVINLKKVDSIAPNETKTVSYEKEIPADLSNEISLTSIAKVSYEDEQKDTNQIVLNAEPAEIVGEVWWNTVNSEIHYNDTIAILASITNNTDKPQSGLALQWNLPDGFEIGGQRIIYEDEEKEDEILEPMKTVSLRTLEPR